nr:type II toxin-antitoxin system VapC family toxin [Polaromonas sp. CG_9.11]
MLDTHLLLWAALFPERLPEKADRLMRDTANTLYFSAASIWEINIKLSRPRKDLAIDVQEWRAGMLANGYQELGITSLHAMDVRNLPDLHKDPFDRLLLAQAMREDLTLVTADALLASYPGPILKV